MKSNRTNRMEFERAESERLYLSTEPYFLVKDQKTGEKDLETLVDSGKVESAWVFVAGNGMSITTKGIMLRKFKQKQP